MTPKDKAKELVDRFDFPSGLMSIERKQCASIVVDEIVKALEEYGQTTFELQNMDREFAYWDMVKHNINLL